MKKLILLVPLLLCGCASYNLPAIQADSFIYHRTDPAGGTTIEAKGVKVTATEVIAERASWTTTYPAWSVQVVTEGYRRARTPEEIKAAPVVP